MDIIFIFIAFIKIKHASSLIFPIREIGESVHIQRFSLNVGLVLVSDLCVTEVPLWGCPLVYSNDATKTHGGLAWVFCP